MAHKFSKDSIEFQFGEFASLFYQFQLFNVYMLWLDHSMSAVSVFQLHILKCNRVPNGFFFLSSFPLHPMMKAWTKEEIEMNKEKKMEWNKLISEHQYEISIKYI